MKNIYLISTDKPSRLWTNNLRRRLELDEFPEQHLNQIAKHIYITSDEEIKEGDWLIVNDEDVMQMKSSYDNDMSGEDIWVGDSLNGYATYKDNCKKIILTTDQDLIKDGVQAIDDEFLEWFVVNPSCESVEVDLVSVNEFGSEITVNGYGFDKFIYKITIPNEEPTEEAKQRAKNYMSLKGALEPKQETLEEAAEKEFPLLDTKWCRTGACEEENLHLLGHRRSFIKGAKWQQKRMYSEAIEFAEWIRIKDFQTASKDNWIGLDMKYYTTEELFEQFKNK